MIYRAFTSLFAAMLVLLQSCATYYQDSRVNVLVPNDQDKEFIIMDFSKSAPKAGISPGWYNLSSYGRQSTFSIPFINKDGKTCAMLKSEDSSTNLFREVDFLVESYPILSWEWLITNSETNKTNTPPVKLIVTFETTYGTQKEIELVWGSKSQTEEELSSESPSYFVGEKVVGKWSTEKVHLTKVYQQFWPQEEPYRITDIGIISENSTKDPQYISYIANVKVLKK